MSISRKRQSFEIPYSSGRPITTHTLPLPLTNFNCIGVGACGRVFDWPGTKCVVKCALHNDRGDNTLFDDYNIHVKVAYAARNAEIKILVPDPYYYITANTREWWDKYGVLFPKSFSTPRHVLCSQRIMTVSKSLRNAIINRYVNFKHHQSKSASDFLLFFLFFLGSFFFRQLNSNLGIVLYT